MSLVKKYNLVTKSKEFLAINPVGHIPAMVTAEGSLFESNALLRYVANANPASGLYGANAYEHALVDQWLDFSTTEIDTLHPSILYPVLGYSDLCPEAEGKGQAQLKKLLAILNTKLQGNNYLVGQTLTIADINLFTSLYNIFRLIYDEKQRKIFPNVLSWFENVAKTSAVAEFYGPLRFPKKQFKAVQKAKAEPVAKPVKAAPAKKEAAPKKEAEEEEEEKPKKKEANPLDLLPPSTFNLFDFKTLFVNATDKKEALKTFWETFDAAGYSLWFVKYVKAEGEGKVLYQTNNLMSGFMQRLDDFRKYAFGVHGVYGEEPTLEIRGVWVWRGNGIAQEVKDLPNYEYHTWEQLCSDNQEHKTLVEDFWTKMVEGDIVDNLKAQTVKYFK